MSPPLILVLKPSPVLLASWCVSCGVAASVLFPLLPALALALVLCGLTLIFHRGIRYLQLRDVVSVICLQLDDSGEARWQCRNSSWSQGRLAEVSVIHPWLTVIGLQSGLQRRWLLLAPGSADQDALRRLRVLLQALAGQTVVTQ